jgi:hypothetical protein
MIEVARLTKWCEDLQYDIVNEITIQGLSWKLGSRFFNSQEFYREISMGIRNSTIAMVKNDG